MVYNIRFFSKSASLQLQYILSALLESKTTLTDIFGHTIE